MGFSLEFKKISSRQQSSSKATKEDKLKSKNGVGPPSTDLNYKAQQVADGKGQNRESVKGGATRSDELVKHMSNLPGYLRGTDGGKNVQGKALNVGVLDWTRLEKWRHKQMHIPAFASNFTSLNIRESSSRMAAKSSVSAARNENEKVNNRQGFLSSSIKASYGLPESSKQSFQNVKQSHRSGTETGSFGDEQRITPSVFESSGRSHIEISFEKEKKKNSDKIILQVGNFASNVRHHGISQIPYRNINVETEKSLKGLQDYNLKKKDKNRECTSGMGLTSSKSKGEGVSFHSNKKISVSNSETKKEVEQSRESDINVGQKLHHSKPSNIVLLRSREIPQSSSPHVSQLKMSFDENFTESSQLSLSNVSLLDEVCSVNSEIPHSCELHSMAEPAPTSEAMQHRINTDQDTGHSTFVSKTSDYSKKMYGLPSEGAYDEKDALDIKLRNHCVSSKSNESVDQETAVLTAQRGRNPSPNRRLSFSLSRIGRSFSFKEGSTLPQFSSAYVSVKSGPVTSESSDHLDNSGKKARSHSRTRSSPLRRLLDPILRHKASETHQSAESSRTAKRTLDSINFRTISVNESLHAEKSRGLSTQALLHLTIKNGLPIFKFVLNSERKILAATIKNLASPEKDDSGCCFTFYLVNEIKKKSGGWMSHGSKEKSCGYVSNVVGQMKYLSSKMTERSNQNSKTECFVKEFVLSGIEIGQRDQLTPKFIPSQELAAVVVEIPCGNFGQEGVNSDNKFLKKGCLKCLAEDRCSCSSGENDVSGRTTVILPAGIHGSPNRGEPSPLIYRWKTGGSCDCGGWDIGCKLLVLSNHKERSIISNSSKSHRGRFQLFVQEGAEQNRPLFILVPLKDGFYSVEFSSSITHLQAFFIAVAVLSCKKQSALELNNMHEEISKELSSKNNDGLQGKAPVKYTPIPPLSPVGRV